MIENEIAQRIAAGATGSGLAVWMARVTGVDIVVMFLGGLAASWFLGEPVAEFFNLVKHESAVGFAVGFLSILVMRKLYDTIHAVDASDTATKVIDKVLSLFGGKK
jgi:hypothetical protein